MDKLHTTSFLYGLPYNMLTNQLVIRQSHRLNNLQT